MLVFVGMMKLLEVFGEWIVEWMSRSAGKHAPDGFECRSAAILIQSRISNEEVHGRVRDRAGEQEHEADREACHGAAFATSFEKRSHIALRVAHQSVALQFDIVRDLELRERAPLVRV